MPMSESRLAYPDCETFFTSALESNRGIRLPFPTYGAARMFQTRLHNYRKLCRLDNARIYRDPAEPLHGRSEYDPIRIKIIGPDANGEYWVYAEKLDSAINPDDIEQLEPTDGPNLRG